LVAAWPALAFAAAFERLLQQRRVHVADAVQVERGAQHDPDAIPYSSSSTKDILAQTGERITVLTWGEGS
jgi:hypothetical protein